MTSRRARDSSTSGDRPDRLFAGYIFDLDGTLYLGDELLPGARQLIDALRSLDRKILFLSNNPTKSADDYALKLTRLGIPAAPAQVLNTVDTMTSWLLRHHPDATVFPIGEPPLKQALIQAGLKISEDPTEIDIVIASYDRTFEYRKLQIAFDAIRTYGRARLVTTNPDRFCPLPGGHGEPDAAAVIGAIEGCTGTRCEQNTGKPDPYMLEAALNRLQLTASECIMIGDRLMTDIRMAIDAGMHSALVLTGETTRELLRAAHPAEHPTWVLNRVDDVLPTRCGALARRPVCRKVYFARKGTRTITGRAVRSARLRPWCAERIPDPWRENPRSAAFGRGPTRRQC